MVVVVGRPWLTLGCMMGGHSGSVYPGASSARMMPTVTRTAHRRSSDTNCEGVASGTAAHMKMWRLVAVLFFLKCTLVIELLVISLKCRKSNAGVTDNYANMEFWMLTLMCTDLFNVISLSNQTLKFNKTDAEMYVTDYI